MSDEDKVEVLVESRVDDVASGAAKSAKVKEAETATTVEVRSLKRYTKEEKPSRSIGKILAVGLLAIVLVGGLIGTIVFYNLQPVRRDYQWWHKTTIYQIYPRSFKDSDGDGIGDLKGIESKLDHLKGLGIETIWLSPVFQSPMKDFGYDIENFIAIDKLFGTLDDFKDLMREVKKRELRLIMDFVPNHSSDRHEWFINSTNASEECPEYADYYVWHEGHPRWTVDRNGTTIKAPPNNWHHHLQHRTLHSLSDTPCGASICTVRPGKLISLWLGFLHPLTAALARTDPGEAPSTGSRLRLADIHHVPKGRKLGWQEPTAKARCQVVVRMEDVSVSGIWKQRFSSMTSSRHKSRMNENANTQAIQMLVMVVFLFAISWLHSAECSSTIHSPHGPGSTLVHDFAKCAIYITAASTRSSTTP
ncbi:putative Maltase A2 [Hypsibius exemplaris]|uniref:alpha-glucosidase n=1 Tax=Hypsibius exemplaris TaxID=2072580 RepID=A0A1W0WXF4_HYPEX|nr:putative Maltase A2 [Hypsibius exemplaris]